MTTTALNLSAFEKAWSLVQADEAHFAKRHLKEVEATRPYDGWKVLHNIPVSLETVCKLEALVVGGADVTVTSPRFLIPATFDQAVELLEEIGIRYIPDQKIDQDYDFYLDCSGELADAPTPKRGIVELTQTGSQVYRSRVYRVPVLSVDDSRLKGLETFFGTGDGFRRAFGELSDERIEDHSFIIFGYGRVGRGVAYPILQAGRPVAVVDGNPAAVERAKAEGCQGFHLEDRGAWEAALKESTAVVTATGVNEAMSQLFSSAEAFEGKILCNMGAEDEFGEPFVGQRVLNERLPINFALRHPTAMRYLDLIFYAHSRAMEWIVSRELGPGYHALPSDIDDALLSDWEKIYKEDVSLI